jgi:acetyl esterase/lipase
MTVADAMYRGLGIAVLLATIVAAAHAQETDLAARMDYEFRVVPNLTYVKGSNWESKLDLYIRKDAAVQYPTVIYIHGGGWTRDTKEARGFTIQPYLAMGLNVVNVEYRLAEVALAPAAVEDTRCALKWVLSHAKEYGIDSQKIVLAGDSAGGHLALITGFLPASAGMERQCARNDYLGRESVPTEMKVAAIINWYGISDVNELLDGPAMYAGAVAWLGSQPDRDGIAKRVSPLTYIRAGVPPVLTIHGDKDRTVPYTQSVRLHQALTKAGVPNELLTMPGGGHSAGCCNLEQRVNAYRRIQAFLRKQGVLSTPISSARQ